MSDKELETLSKAPNYENDDDAFDYDEADPMYADEFEHGEYEPAYDEEDLGEGFHEIDPEEEDSDPAAEWLRDNDIHFKHEPDYHEDDHADDAEYEKHRAAVESAVAQKEAEQPKQQRSSAFRQPSREELIEMRSYTRPWEARARDAARLQAEAHKNPVLHHQGKIIEARNLAHQDRKKAYNEFINSEAYKNADPITQMEMDDQFEKDWHAKNPEHLSSYMAQHRNAHKEGLAAHDIHAALKDEQIRHLFSGGTQPEYQMSTEEALQHAGGAKGEEGTSGTIMQDPTAAFAHANQEFIKQYAQQYANKGKKVATTEDMHQYDSGVQKDIGRILGEHTTKNPKVDKFFEHYHPLIGMSARRVLNKLGLDEKRGNVDMSMLHEAGMHGLMQAINDYDHDHPSKASFASHAGNKIRGLMQSALKSQDQIPAEVRQAQKRFMASGQQTAPKMETSQPTQATAMPKMETSQPTQAAPAPKVETPKSAHVIIRSAKHPNASKFYERIKRIDSAKALHAPKTKIESGSNDNQ